LHNAVPENLQLSSSSDQDGYWVDQSSREGSQYNNFESLYKDIELYKDSYKGIDLPDTTAYFIQPCSLELSIEAVCNRILYSIPIVTQALHNYTAIPVLPIHKYRSCQQSFASRTKLFKYLENYQDYTDDPPASDQNCTNDFPVSAQTVSATTDSTPNLPERISNILLFGIGTGIGYCRYTYTIAPVRLSKSAKAEPCCFDTGCSVLLIDKQFLKKQDPTALIYTIASPLKINRISGNQYTISEYIVATM
jgi:hypothetical protein